MLNHEMLRIITNALLSLARKAMLTCEILLNLIIGVPILESCCIVSYLEWRKVDESRK
jgi:hypothetical protein